MEVSLVTGLRPYQREVEDDLWTAHLRAQHQADWIFYTPRGMKNHMSSAEFCIAMAIRCRSITDYQREQTKHLSCGCGETFTERIEDVVQHSLVCKCNRFTPAHRHNIVKYAMANVIRSFGFQVTIEPHFYVYESGIQRRPDLTVHVQGYQDIATDLVIVKQEGRVGANAERAAAEKIKIHKKAVERSGHIFIPYAMEVHGHRTKQCAEFVDAIGHHLSRPEYYRFLTRFNVTVSSALAQARVKATLSSCQPAEVW
jgi:hypothetical protein